MEYIQRFPLLIVLCIIFNIQSHAQVGTLTPEVDTYNSRIGQ